MEEMYEVLKFIEHGNQCRVSLDCVQGTSLMHYLREHPRIEKTVLISWFRGLAQCVKQYHRARNCQNYRYLNPCSIVVTEEGGLLLLDLEAPDNAGALKQMQKGAVRSHFVKPVYEIGVSKNHEADLFAYGKTIQFMLAYTEVHPPLTKWEEIRLEKVIARCIGERRNRYEDFQQVLRALPPIPKENHERKVDVRHILSGVAVGTTVCLALCILLGIGKSGLSKSSGVHAEPVEAVEKDLGDLKRDRDELRVELEQVKRERETEQRDWIVAREVEGGFQKAAETTAGIDKMQLEDELLFVYESLLQYETDVAKVEEIGLKKMELEAKNGDYESALLTGETVLGRIMQSEKISMLMEEYRKNII